MFGSIRLNVESLETREVPAVIGWVNGGPQPEPPTVVGKVSILLPALSKLDAGTTPKAGILLPALNQIDNSPALEMNGILFPVFKAKQSITA